MLGRKKQPPVSQPNLAPTNRVRPPEPPAVMRVLQAFMAEPMPSAGTQTSNFGPPLANAGGWSASGNTVREDRASNDYEHHGTDDFAGEVGHGMADSAVRAEDTELGRRIRSKRPVRSVMQRRETGAAYCTEKLCGP